MRPYSAFAALCGLIAVALGAYAAHGLAGNAQALAERASQYQLIHALALLAADRFVAEGRRYAHLAAGLFVVGIVLFCGSLTFKALVGPLFLPQITPAGGIALMLAWLALAITSLAPPHQGSLFLGKFRQE